VETGDRVAGIFMQNWLMAHSPRQGQRRSGGDMDGMAAEYVPSGRRPGRLPEHLSFEEAPRCPAPLSRMERAGRRHLKPGRRC